MHVDYPEKMCAPDVSASSVHQRNHEFNIKAGTMLPFLLGVCPCAHFVLTSQLV